MSSGRSNDNSISVRHISLEILLLLDREPERLSHLVLRQTMDKYDYLKEEDKALIKTLTEGTLERRLTLDYVIDLFSKTRTEKMKPMIRILLEQGAYQLLYMDRIPEHAVVNEAVKECKNSPYAGLSGFVNGVLRSIAGGKASIRYPKHGHPDYLSVTYSVPKPLADEILKWYGGKRAEAILKASFDKRLCLRVPEKSEAAFNELNKDFVTVHPYACHAYTLKEGCSLKDLKGFEEGLFTVQDVSSILAVSLAGIRAGDRILDCCSAPGGKSAYAASLAGDKGHVDARDISSEKLSLIEDNFRRMKIPASCYDIRQADAAQRDENLSGLYDVVLADLPCSGLGVLSKKTDIKYHVTEETMEELAALQGRILDTVCEYVKPGGILLFSTCTINPGENTKNRRVFLEKHPEFRAESLKEGLSSKLIEDLSEEELEAAERGELQLLGGIHRSDGFYISKFVRM